MKYKLIYGYSTKTRETLLSGALRPNHMQNDKHAWHTSYRVAVACCALRTHDDILWLSTDDLFGISLQYVRHVGGNSNLKKRRRPAR